MAISGFTFGHNLIDSGYPIIEAIFAIQDYVSEIVFVDMQSTDTTRQVVEKLGCTVINGEWGNQAGVTLAKAHALHSHCKHDTIIHFEADEVFDDELIYNVYRAIEAGQSNLLVYRLQVEQNFQRIRWYPEKVHRVFLKDTVIKDGHTTDLHKQNNIPTINTGYLWDCTNCFRDNWLDRVEKQAKLWNEEPKYRYVPIHFNQPIELTREQAHYMLAEEHWRFKTTPLFLPESLNNLLGLAKYSDSVAYQRLIR